MRAAQFLEGHHQEKEVRTGKMMMPFMQMKGLKFSKKRLRES
jgi:hypothetical protein